MLFKVDFPRMKKFRGEYYELERVHKDETVLEKRGSELRRRGKVLSDPIKDYEVVEHRGYYGLYIR